MKHAVNHHESRLNIESTVGTKPAFISQGWGPQRHANGEIATRAISMLAILTGNVGINGGNSGARDTDIPGRTKRSYLHINPDAAQTYGNEYLCGNYPGGCG